MRRMNPILRQLLVALTVFAFLFVQLAGCGGGSSGDRTPPGVSEPLVLSHARIAPLDFLTIEHPSIEEGREILVAFDDGNGFRISAPATFVGAGAAQIPAPPYFYLDSGGTVRSGGSVAVSIEGLNASAALRIDALPDVSAFSPGQLTSWFLELGIGNMREIMAVLSQHSSPSDPHAAQLQYSMQEAAMALQGLQDQFRSGTPVIEFDGAGVALSRAEIALLDQIHLAVMEGLWRFAIQHNLVQPGSIQPMSGIPPLPLSTYDDWRKLVDDITDSLRGVDALHGIVGIVLILGGGTVGGTVAGPIGAAGGIAIAGAILMFSSGVVVFTESARRHIDAQEGQGRQSAQLTEGLFVRTWETIKSVGLTLGGYATEGLARALITIADLGHNLASVLGIIDRDRWPDLPGVQDHFPFGMTPSGPSELVVGESGSWRVAVGGGIPPYSVVYAWGDGQSQGQHGMGSLSEMSHAYTAPGSYTVSIVARDSVSRQVGGTLGVRVVDGLAARWMAIPSALDVGEPGTWSVGITGGTSPYRVTFNWGDGSSSTVVSNAAGEVATAAHAYGSARAYSITVGIEDARGRSAQLTTSVEVVGVVAECINLSGRWSMYGEIHEIRAGVEQEPIVTPTTVGSIRQTGCSFDLGGLPWVISDYDLVEVHTALRIEYGGDGLVQNVPIVLAGRATETSFILSGTASWSDLFSGDPVEQTHFYTWDRLPD